MAQKRVQVEIKTGVNHKRCKIKILLPERGQNPTLNTQPKFGTIYMTKFIRIRLHNPRSRRVISTRTAHTQFIGIRGDEIMFARMVRSHVLPGKTDKALAIWRDKIVPIMKEARGFNGAYVIGDRETGQGITITFWETEADAITMNSSFGTVIVFFEGLLEGPPELSQLEVLLQV